MTQAVTPWQAGTLYAPGDIVEARVQSQFQFKAVQGATARSGSVEPIWPTALGQTVEDGGVIWQAVAVDIQEWEAVPIGKTGASEPAWPSVPFEQSGTLVADGTARWKAIAPVVTDPRAPAAKAAIVLGSKAFAAGEDIVRFSATNNALDWTTLRDAGFLPTGQQTTGEVRPTALAQYRSNLVVFTPTSAQVWQVDPDPQRMSLLDIIEGVGTRFHRAHASIGDDLFFLTRLGVRSLSVTGGSQNLQTGDVGAPVDAILQPLIDAATDPRMLYYPARGQLWVIFGVDVYVLTSSPQAGVAAWSHYVFPGAIDAWAILDGELYLRIGNDVYRFDENATTDDGQAIPVTVQWPWLDLGELGQTKMMLGFDISASAACQVSVGYDQSNPAAFTNPYTVGPDTLPGQVIPLPLMAPSFSPKVTHSANQPFELNSLTLYLQDQRPMA